MQNVPAKRIRHIVKSSDIVPTEEHTRTQYLRGLFRGLDSSVKEQAKFGLFLQLVNSHLDDGTTPPALQLDILPPGFNVWAYTSVIKDWFEELARCSRQLLCIMQKHYLAEMRSKSLLTNSLTKQCANALSKHKQCSRHEAILEVENFVDLAVTEVVEHMSELFYEHECRKSNGDEDHRRWIEEQSEFVQRLSLADQERTSPSPSRNSSRRWLDTTTLDKVYSKSSRSRSEKSDTIRRIEAEEEELKYVDFINEITNDILSRGIYSDVVLDQTMERHVQRKRNELDENKMRKMLRKLKEDLGMSDDLPSRSNMLHTSTTLEDTRYSSKEEDRKTYSVSSSQGAKDKDRKSSSKEDQFQFKVSVSGAEEEVDSGSYAGFSGLPSSSSRTTRRTKVLRPSPSITSISSIHSERKSVELSIKKHAEESVEASETVKSTSEHEINDETASKPILEARSSDLEATLKDSDAKSGSEELKTTTTSSLPPGEVEESSVKVKSSSDEDEESDYESVAALSMALKPGNPPRQDPGSTLGSTAPEKSEDAAAYSDDFDDNDF